MFHRKLLSLITDKNQDKILNTPRATMPVSIICPLCMDSGKQTTTAWLITAVYSLITNCTTKHWHGAKSIKPPQKNKVRWPLMCRAGR